MNAGELYGVPARSFDRIDAARAWSGAIAQAGGLAVAPGTDLA
jgi:hypothetical protein